MNGLELIEKSNDYNGIKLRIKVIASIFAWFKALYFFRVSDDLGYLVFMIIEVLKDIIPFMIVFIIFITAFAGAEHAAIQLENITS